MFSKNEKTRFATKSGRTTLMGCCMIGPVPDGLYVYRSQTKRHRSVCLELGDTDRADHHKPISFHLQALARRKAVRGLSIGPAPP